MGYKTVKVGERIIFVPDDDLKKRLRAKTRKLRDWLGFARPYPCVSTFKRKRGLKRFLMRHQKGRFFVAVDFVYAFHQITREMAGLAIPQLLNHSFDDCFVQLNGKEVIPQGFPTSSYIFELVMLRLVDRGLNAWAEEHKGVVTRYCDNVLVTWKKDTPEAFRDLHLTFERFRVRFTPKRPRKWDSNSPIRFCGFILHQDGRVGLSRQRKKKLIFKATQACIRGDIRSAQGIEQFVELNS